MGAEQSSEAMPWPREVVQGTKILYHGAPGQVAASVLTNGLKPSSGGRLGPGIYLTDNKQLAERAAKRNGHQFVVSCYVELGTMAKVPGGQWDRFGSWRKAGCHSCTGTHPTWLGMPPFTEYVVADPSRVQIFQVEGFVASRRNLITAPKPVVRLPSRKPNFTHANAPQPQQAPRALPSFEAHFYEALYNPLDWNTCDEADADGAACGCDIPVGFDAIQERIGQITAKPTTYSFSAKAGHWEEYQVTLYRDVPDGTDDEGKPKYRKEPYQETRHRWVMTYNETERGAVQYNGPGIQQMRREDHARPRVCVRIKRDWTGWNGDGQIAREYNRFKDRHRHGSADPMQFEQHVSKPSDETILAYWGGANEPQLGLTQTCLLCFFPVRLVLCFVPLPCGCAAVKAAYRQTTSSQTLHLRM